MAGRGSVEELRKALKKWENAFVIVHERKPNKEDIAVAPKDIKEKYRCYQEAKKLQQREAPLNNSKNEEKTEIWGAELNKKPEERPDEPSPNSRTKSDGTSNVLHKLGDKLFQNAPTLHSLKTRDSVPKKPKNIFKHLPLVEESINVDAGAKPTSEMADVASPIPLTTSTGTGDLSPRASLETGKIDTDNEVKGVLFKHGQKFLKKSHGSQSFLNKPACSSRQRQSFLLRNLSKTDISLSAECDEASYPSDPSQKETTCSGGSSLCKDFEQSKGSGDIFINRDKFRNVNSNLGNLRDEEVSSWDSQSPYMFANGMSSKTNDHEHHGIEDSSQTHRAINLSQSLHQNIVMSPSVAKDSSFSAYKEPIHGQGIKNFKMKESLMDETDSMNIKGREHKDNFDMRDVPGCSKELIDKDLTGATDRIEETAVVRRTMKRKRMDSETDNNFSADVEHQDGVMDDGSHKDEAVSILQKQPVAKKPSATKLSASKLNDNFVRLNMKKKGYRRKGAAGLTGGQLRRKQWKQKMSARSQSFGSNKCFKCGQEGHWANKCSASKAAKIIPEVSSSEPVEESDFPSLRKAALMARGTGKESTGNEEDVADAADITDIEASIVREKWEEGGDIASTQTPAAVEPLSSVVKVCLRTLKTVIRLITTDGVTDIYICCEDIRFWQHSPFHSTFDCFVGVFNYVTSHRRQE